MQEVDYRERNLRLSEMAIFVYSMQRILGTLVEVSNLPAAAKTKSLDFFQKEAEKVLGHYEAELFQERYLPEYQRNQRNISRREKEEMLRKQQELEEQKKKVESLSQE